MRTKQLSAVATARVIWLCVCVMYWPYLGVNLGVAYGSGCFGADIGTMYCTQKLCQQSAPLSK